MMSKIKWDAIKLSVLQNCFEVGIRLIYKSVKHMEDTPQVLVSFFLFLHDSGTSWFGDLLFLQGESEF